MNHQDLKALLEEKVEQYNHVSFIESDPISIPHQFSKQQDIEIAAFWTAVLSWGQRTTIIAKSKQLFDWMDGQPHDFICNASDTELKVFEKFKHRTFLAEDTLYFIAALKALYARHTTMEEVFLHFGKNANDERFMFTALSGFHDYFFSLAEGLERTKKHISSPVWGSTFKRLNMFMRWMVRKDDRGVDFGIWQNIPMAALMIPYDLHVDRVARHLRLVDRKQKDWGIVEEITSFCRSLDKNDPAKFDYALFGLSISGELDEYKLIK